MRIYIIYVCLPRHIPPVYIFPRPGIESLKTVESAAIKPENSMIEDFYFNIVRRQAAHGWNDLHHNTDILFHTPPSQTTIFLLSVNNERTKTQYQQ